MIELELYRQRIGTFSCKLTSNKCQVVKVSRHLSREHRFCVKEMFILGTVALCLVLLGCQLEEQEAVGWPSSSGTICHKILCIVRSLYERCLHCELKWNMPDNIDMSTKFRNNFQVFSYVFTEEQNYQTNADLVDVSFIVERHGTYSYLLGNAGQHAYNGNPLENRRFQDTSQSDTDLEIRKLHYKMVKCLDEEIGIECDWTSFKEMLRIYLSPKKVRGVNNMFNACEKLSIIGVIKFGKYDKLKDLFDDNEICCDIVDKFSSKIKELQYPHTQQAICEYADITELDNTSQSTDKTQAKGSCTITAKLSVTDEIGRQISEIDNFLVESLRSVIEEQWNVTLADMNRQLKTVAKEISKILELLEIFERKEIRLAAARKKSIILSFRVTGVRALKELWHMYQSKELLNMLQEALITDFHLMKFNVDCIKLDISMSEKDYKDCLKALEKCEECVKGSETDIAGTKTLRTRAKTLRTRAKMLRTRVDDVSFSPEKTSDLLDKNSGREKCEECVKGSETDIAGTKTLRTRAKTLRTRAKMLRTRVDDVSFSPEKTSDLLDKNSGREKCEECVKGSETDIAGTKTLRTRAKTLRTRAKMLRTRVDDVSFSPEKTSDLLDKNSGRGSLTITAKLSAEDEIGRQNFEINNFLVEKMRSAFEQKKKETLANMKGQLVTFNKDANEMLELLEKLEEKEIQLGDAENKCIILSFNVTGERALKELWHMYQSKELLNMLQEALMTDFPFVKFKVKCIKLDISMSEKDYRDCLKALEKCEESVKGSETDISGAKTLRTRVDDVSFSPEKTSDLLDKNSGRAISEAGVEGQDVDIRETDMMVSGKDDVPITRDYTTQSTDKIQAEAISEAGVKEKYADIPETDMMVSGKDDLPIARDYTNQSTDKSEVKAISEAGVKEKYADIPETDMMVSGKDDLPIARDYTNQSTDKSEVKAISEAGVKEKYADIPETDMMVSGKDDLPIARDYTNQSTDKSEVKAISEAGVKEKYADIPETDMMVSGKDDLPIARDYTNQSTDKSEVKVSMKLVVESWEEQDKLCYETKRVKAVKEKICNDSYVCVIGVPGSGKSTAIRHAALHLQETLQYTIYPLHTPEEFDKYLDENKKQVFVEDDVVGEYSVDKEMLGLWDSCNDRIKRCLEVRKNTKFLTSLRLQLYLDETLKGKTYIFNDTDNKVNFSDISLEEMENMLRHRLEVRKVGNIEALIKDICGEMCWKYWAAKSANYFPLLCEVFSDNESVRENPWKFFTEPFPALIDIFRQIKIKNKHQFCGLLLCAFMELKREYLSRHYPHDKPKIFTLLIESLNLDPEKDLDDIKNALHALDGVYISHVANKYDFSHSTFRDITTFLYEDKYVIFQHATLYFIKSRVRLFSKLSEDDDYVLVYGEDCIELLVNRMIRELKCQAYREGVGFIVDNRYIDDERVVNGLCTKLFDSQDTDITQATIDGLFGECMEAVWEYSVDHRDNRDEISWRCYKLLVRLIPRVDCTRRIDVLGTYPVLACVYTGSLSLTKLVAQQNIAVINAVDDYNYSVLHEALSCGNNVEMTRYLLSLPNLTRLNHRDEDGKTPYWYVVHGREPECEGSLANRQEMIDIYKQSGAIAIGDSSVI